MKLFTFTKFVMAFTCAIIIFYLYWFGFNHKNHNRHRPMRPPQEPLQAKSNDIVLVVVACGDRVQETLNVLKSALMFTKVKIEFVVIAEDKLIPNFKEKLSDWQLRTNNSFDFRVMHLTFPADDSHEWKRLFKPCASQRLFLPTLLSDIDSVLYVDTDTLFLTPIETVWDYFYKMNASQMAALAPEHEDPNVSWYTRFARHPYYGKLGVNSGVMLMNLTKMRQFKWTDNVIPIYKKYKLKITWGDQDIINIIFHYHPDKLLVYSCRYNYRSDHCMYMSVCKPAEKEGVAIVHGSRGVFHSEKQPIFEQLYKAFDEFTLGGDLYRDFYAPLKVYLDSTVTSNCRNVRHVFLKNMEKYIPVEDFR